MRIIHWFDFETWIIYHDQTMTVKVEATLSSDSSGDVELEGYKTFLIDEEGTVYPTELVLNDEQARKIETEIYERVNEPGSDVIDDPKNDWRNEWE